MLVESAAVGQAYSATEVERVPRPDAYSTMVSPAAAGDDAVTGDPSVCAATTVPRPSPVVEKYPTDAGAARTVISLLSTPATLAFSLIFPEPAVAHGIRNVIALGATLRRPTGSPFAVSDVAPNFVGSGRTV